MGKKKDIEAMNKQIGLFGLVAVVVFTIAMAPALLLLSPLIALGLINQNKGQ